VKKDKMEYFLRGASIGVSCDIHELHDLYKCIIIDEVALIVLYEFGILETLFKLFSNVIINKSTYQNFSKSSHDVFGSMYSRIPKDIVKTLGENIECISVRGVTDEISSIDQYVALVKDCDEPLICSDDLYMTEIIKLQFPDKGYLNSLGIVELLYKSNLIDNDKRIELISKFCSLPIIGHSIGMNHLVDSLEFYINNKSILDTPFSYIFDAVFTLEKDKKNSLIEMCSMFSDLLNKNNSDIEIGRIHSLLDVWLVRNSFDTRENML